MKDKKQRMTMKNYAILLLLALIVINAAVYGFTHIEGASNYGDDANYLYLASTVLHGNFLINPGYIFSVRLMSFMPIALIYFLFGVTNLTSTLWNVLSYIGIIIVTYLATKLLYDYKAALISAFVVSIFPIVTQHAVNICENVPLTFITSLAVLLFLYAERENKKWQYFASGVMLVVSWLISYEAAIIILLVLLYALVQVIRKRIMVDRTSLFFICGIVLSFAATFIFSYLNSGMPFATITTNLRFYSGIGQRVDGLPTIPSSTTDLYFYINTMFQYRIGEVLLQNGLQGLPNIWNMLTYPMNPTAYGLYFYLLIITLVPFLIFEKRSYFMVFWLAFIWLFLEFGPMHVDIISIIPLQVNYLLAHRLERFMMVLAVPLAAIAGVSMSMLISMKDKRLLPLGGGILVFMLVVLFVNNYVISEFWYQWQYYPMSITLRAADFLRPYAFTNTIYIDGLVNGGGVSVFGANLPSFFGYPSDPHYLVVGENASCSSFVNNSYAVWAGNPGCGRFVNVFNITIPKNIPDYVIQGQNPNMPLIPTNIYFVR